jgi:hypothetical protein
VSSRAGASGARALAADQRPRASRQNDRSCRRQLFSSCGNVEANGGERLAGHARGHAETKADVERRGWPNLEQKAVIFLVCGEEIDESLAQLGAADRLTAAHEVQVARSTRALSEAPFEDRPALHDPCARLGRTEPRHDSLEDEASPQSVDLDVVQFSLAR